MPWYAELIKVSQSCPEYLGNSKFISAHTNENVDAFSIESTEVNDGFRGSGNQRHDAPQPNTNF